MKKIVLAITVALMTSASTMAQDENKGGNRPERGRMNQTEMIQRRTQHTVEQYGLNETQAKQLLELNTKFAGKMGGPRGGRGMGPRGNGDRRGDFKKDSLKREKPANANAERRQPSQDDMRKNMEAYEAELQKIMTADQFKAYKADMEKRMKEGRRGGQGGRPNRNRN